MSDEWGDDPSPLPDGLPDFRGDFSPCCTVAIDDYCRMGITVDDHCFVALIRQELGYWEPVTYIPPKVAALIMGHPEQRCDAA